MSTCWVLLRPACTLLLYKERLFEYSSIIVWHLFIRAFIRLVDFFKKNLPEKPCQVHFGFIISGYCIFWCIWLTEYHVTPRTSFQNVGFVIFSLWPPNLHSLGDLSHPIDQWNNGWALTSSSFFCELCNWVVFVFFLRFKIFTSQM